MAYAGYRLKIDNTVFNNTYIAKGSYSMSREKRVAKEWKDLEGIAHKTYFPTDKAIITFSIREHLATDHQTIASFFSSESVEVQYWNDKINDYSEGSFEVEDIDWGHRTVTPDGAFYKTAKVTLKEW